MSVSLNNLSTSFHTSGAPREAPKLLNNPVRPTRKEASFRNKKIQLLNQIAATQRKRGLHPDLNPYADPKPKPLPMNPQEKEALAQKIKTLREIGATEAVIQDLVEGTEFSKANAEEKLEESTSLPLETIKDTVGDLSTMNESVENSQFEEQFVSAILKILKGFKVTKSQLNTLKQAIDNLPGKGPSTSQKKTILKIISQVESIERSIDIDGSPQQQRDEYFELKNTTIPTVRNFLESLLDYEPPKFSSSGPSQTQLNMTGTPAKNTLLAGHPSSDGTAQTDDKMVSTLNRLRNRDPNDNQSFESVPSTSLSPRQLDFASSDDDDDDVEDKVPTMLSGARDKTRANLEKIIDKELATFDEDDRQFVVDKIMEHRYVPNELVELIGDLPASMIQMELAKGQSNELKQTSIDQIREKSKQMAPKFDKIQQRLNNYKSNDNNDTTPINRFQQRADKLKASHEKRQAASPISFAFLI